MTSLLAWDPVYVLDRGLWLSNLSIDQNHLGHLLKYKLRGPTFWISDTVGLGWDSRFDIFSRSPADPDADAVGSGLRHFRSSFFPTESFCHCENPTNTVVSYCIRPITKDCHWGWKTLKFFQACMRWHNVFLPLIHWWAFIGHLHASHYSRHGAREVDKAGDASVFLVLRL